MIASNALVLCYSSKYVVADDSVCPGFALAYMNDSIMTSSLTARLETGMEQVTLRAVSECSYNERMAIRDVRNQESVRRSMYTDHIIEVDEHNRWIDAVIKDNRQIVFAVIVGGVVSGAVSLSSIDHRHKKSDWAFYLDHTVRGGLGAAIEFFLLDYAFFLLVWKS